MTVIQSTSSHKTICTHVSSPSSSSSYPRSVSFSLTPFIAKKKNCVYVLVIRLLKYFVCLPSFGRLNSAKVRFVVLFDVRFSFDSVEFAFAFGPKLLSGPSQLFGNEFLWLCALAHLDQKYKYYFVLLLYYVPNGFWNMRLWRFTCHGKSETITSAI